jgi:protein-S-isoprenylcysteine O-methyltransferase Ste14
VDAAILIVWVVFWLGWLVVAAVMGAYFGYSAVMEERTLIEQFPEAYPRYRARTKLLIPFLL